MTPHVRDDDEGEDANENDDDDDDDDESDAEEHNDAALYDEDRTRVTHVVRVRIAVRWRGVEGDDAAAAAVAKVNAMRWTRAREMCVVEAVGREIVLDNGDDTIVTVDATVSFRGRACASEEGRLARAAARAVGGKGRGKNGTPRAGAGAATFDVLDCETLMTAPGYVPLGAWGEVRGVSEEGEGEGRGWGRAAEKGTADIAVHEETVVVRRFLDEGCVACTRAVESNIVKELLGNVYRFIDKVEAQFATAHAHIKYGEDAFAFKEIGSRGGKRFDALVDLDAHEWKSLRMLAHHGAPWLRMIHVMLPHGWNVHVSVIYSQPGAKYQEWHADGRHLDAQCDPRTGTGQASPYGVCVFMPLIDLDYCTGFTQFFLKSHKTSSLIGFGEAAAMLQCAFDGILSAGESVLYDYRLLHRGMGNTSRAIRPVLQFLYTAPTYRETKNYGVDSLWAGSNPALS